MLANNHPEEEARLHQLCQAIKLIYASVFFKETKAYIESTSSKVEEEKMAIIIQEVVGKEYKGRFYPTFSGVAQSYNFYPIGHQTYEDGIVSVAVGLGKAVAGGERVLRFCPRYPTHIPELSTPDQMFENLQRELYVLDTTTGGVQLSERDDVTLKKVNVVDIKNDGTLDFISSMKKSLLAAEVLCPKYSDEG